MSVITDLDRVRKYGHIALDSPIRQCMYIETQIDAHLHKWVYAYLHMGIDT
jgi:hypothetical protein